MGWGYHDWKPYVSVHEKKRNAEREVERLRKKGHALAPVAAIAGNAIAHTFWGKSWCRNLERYSDYSNRLPRGRSYVRNGAVVDLQVEPGEVRARVSGSSLYEVRVKIAPLQKPRWQAVCQDCAGGIDSLVELLQGQLSRAVMERVCEEGRGLFPSPAEIEFDCSCPDWASMCKHVAATLYGVGARLDAKPDLLFRLRKVDEMELVAHAGAGTALAAAAPGRERILDGAGVADLFGLELEAPSPGVGLAEQASEYAAAAPRKRRRQGRGAVEGDALVIDDALRAKVAAEVQAALAPTLALLDRAAAFMGCEVRKSR
ncbi:MAG TPA: hypothetical protein VGK67_00985 [Myxococcales bacterium]|jgi:uncharacterized Zn finger protein